ncbi:MAG: hypothetical protein L6Q84_35000 [Polyangiaceae bacterium]|nr:hypothetical protein [Polyangiaceae bacterium]
MRIRSLAVVLAGVSGVFACGGSDDSDGGGGGASSCASDPLSCGADKTCWLADIDTGRLDCLIAPTDKAQGAACQNVVGQAQCNAGLSCFPGQSGSASGTCQPFCGPNQTCSGGALCTALTLVSAPSSAPIYVCAPAGTGGTGGAGGTDGGGGTGGGTGGTGGGTGGTGGAADAGGD